MILVVFEVKLPPDLRPGIDLAVIEDLFSP
jgi:hypothetical protein